MFAEKNIQEFMRFYQETFPDATVLPKMHILEDHTVPWMRRWHIGAGLMGEQGAESIHAHFQHLERVYAGMLNALKRMECLMKEHYIETAPSTASLCPPVKRHNTDSTDQASPNMQPTCTSSLFTYNFITGDQTQKNI